MNFNFCVFFFPFLFPIGYYSFLTFFFYYFLSIYISILCQIKSNNVFLFLFFFFKDIKSFTLMISNDKNFGIFHLNIFFIFLYLSFSLTFIFYFKIILPFHLYFSLIFNYFLYFVH